MISFGCLQKKSNVSFEPQKYLSTPVSQYCILSFPNASVSNSYLLVRESRFVLLKSEYRNIVALSLRNSLIVKIYKNEPEYSEYRKF